MKVEDSTLAVVRALERMGVRHYVCGSLASSLHGAGSVGPARPAAGLGVKAQCVGTIASIPSSCTFAPGFTPIFSLHPPGTSST